jgi:hypothetical protein
VYIIQVNCAIFLHAGDAKTGESLDPHDSLDIVSRLKDENKLLGCGCRFQLVKNEDGKIVSKKLYE